MSEENIVKAKEFLNNIDWTKTNAEHLQHKLEEMVTKICEPIKKTKVYRMMVWLTEVRILSQDMSENG